MVGAGAVALGPTLVVTPAMTLAPPAVAAPSVHIEDIQLAGIGQDIYYAIQPWVAYGFELAQWSVAWIPPLSSQIGILYFAGIQPVVEATVNALAGIVQNPFNIIGTLSAYGATLGVIGYNFFAAEAAWFGFPLPPLPPLSSVSGSSAPLAAARAAVASLAPAEVTAEVTAEVLAPAKVSRGELRRVARNAVVPAAQAARTAVTEMSEAAQQTGAEVSAAAQTAAGGVRSTARATRGAVARAAEDAGAAVKAAADSAG